MSHVPFLLTPLTQGVLLCAVWLSVMQARAQESAAPETPTPAQQQNTALPNVSVQATREAAGQPTPEPTTTLSGAALRHRAASTLGATLQDELGVANASFGANVGLPVIRGLSGARVRTLVGGAGTHDASTISADHAVMTEPLLADSITVWKGPAAVRFGGGALGGAVEIEDGRIPTTLPSRTRFKGDVRGGMEGRSAVAKLDGRLSNAVAWHVDVHGRNQNDTTIPGWAQDEAAIRQQFGLGPTSNSRGHVPNTDARSGGGALGASWLGEAGWLGLSLSTLSQNYGIPPGGHSHSHGGTQIDHAEERVRIDARQHRLDLRGELDLPGDYLQKLKLRTAHTDYEHDELESGVVATTFVNRVDELQLELEHKLLQTLVPSLPGQTTGSIGVHTNQRQFSALGAEAFAPEVQARQAALFAVQSWQDGPWHLEVGGRIEYVTYRPDRYRLARDGEEVIKVPPERRLRPGSWSASAKRDIGHGDITLTRWMVSRAPDLQELYADGPHMATRTYDLGRESMGVETLRGWDLGVTQTWAGVTLDANVYRYDSSNYIYQRSTGRYYNTDIGGVRFECARLDLCLPVTQYEQAAARLHGYELELSRPWQWRPADDGIGLRGRVALTSDGVRGRLVGGGDLPRLPPQRVGLRLAFEWPSTTAELHALHALAQKRPGENETDTDGWFQLHGSLRHTVRLSQGQRLSWFVLARNLTNQQVRNSASFLRNYAPEPGRIVQLGMEVSL